MILIPYPFFIGFVLGVLVTILLNKRKQHHRDQHRPVVLAITINGVKGTGMTQIKDDVQANISIEADDKFGNPNGTLDAPPTFSISDPSFGDLTIAADGMTAAFNSNGKLGVFQLLVSAMVGGVALNGQEDITVIAGAASTLKVSVTQ